MRVCFCCGKTKRWSALKALIHGHLLKRVFWQYQRKTGSVSLAVPSSLTLCLSSQVLRWHKPPACHQWSGYERLSGWAGSPSLQWVQHAQCPPRDLRLRQQVQPRGEATVTHKHTVQVQLVQSALCVLKNDNLYSRKRCFWCFWWWIRRELSPGCCMAVPTTAYVW